MALSVSLEKSCPGGQSVSASLAHPEVETLIEDNLLFTLAGADCLSLTAQFKN